ncbi:MAG: hypothetical protein KBG10_01260 [Anaerolineaceae bacterium]|nr:hypothetical protein [Anaerolineaceae bacterium]
MIPMQIPARENHWKTLQIVFLFLMIFLLTLFLIPTPGTGNMDTWVRWANDANQMGLVENYHINHDTYPPLTTVILVGAAKLSQTFGIWIYTAIKLTIVFFLMASSALFWGMTRNALLTAALHLSMLIMSVGLGHLDVFFAPFLIASLWALKKDRLVLFSITFCLAFFTKWQPLIIAPFLALYVFNISRLRDWKQIKFARILKEVVLPVVLVFIFFFVIFGFQPILTAFTVASDHHYLSGNALNINWIITHFLHVFQPDQYGPLVNGQATLIKGPPETVKLYPKLLFFLVYLITLVMFFRRHKTFENLLLFSLLGYWAYFTLNTGVHENHLFIGMILAILLAWQNRKHLLTMLMVIMIENINLIVFNGLDGVENEFSRVVSGVDTALLIAIFNVLTFAAYWVFYTFLQTPKKEEAPALPEK